MRLISTLARSTTAKKIILDAARKRAAYLQQREPISEQREIFRNLLMEGSKTRFGRDYNFTRFANRSFETAYHYYRTQVPIRSYQHFWSDYFSKAVLSGNMPDLQDVTWPGKIKMFCETSGTTAPTKYIPFSEKMFAENKKAGIDLISSYLATYPDSKILDGKILYMSGSTVLSEGTGGVVSGDMSALTLRFRPWYLTPFVEPSPQISSLPWEKKLQAMAELLIKDRDIRAISGVPPWIILLLKRCQEIAGHERLQEILPNLELIIHGGTSIKPYQAEFQTLFGIDQPRFLEVLPSSEAFMGFQCAGDAVMRLTPFYGAFFEFVRFEDLDDNGKPHPYTPAIPLEKVELGQCYAIILSTCAGLWRYHIGDTIRFTSLSPHFIEFTGRDRFLDKLEEKVTQEEVERVIADLNRSGLSSISEFIVGTDVPQRRHVWILAARGGIDCNHGKLPHLVDQRLVELNADYKTFRHQERINEPEVLVVHEDIIYDWSREVRGKLGGQTKIPHIDPTHDGAMVDSLKQFLLIREKSALKSGATDKDKGVIQRMGSEGGI